MVGEPLYLPASARSPINRGDEQGGLPCPDCIDHLPKPANGEAGPTGETKRINAALGEESLDAIRKVSRNNNRLSRSARK